MKKLLLLCLVCFYCSLSFAYVSQANWRWRNNNGTETTATWKAAQNKPILVGSVDSILRLRIQFENNNWESKGINSNLQYATAPDGPWRYITSLQGNNAFVMARTNNYVADLTNTTQQINGSALPFATGKLFVKTCELERTMNAGTTTEFEYCILPTKNISPGTTYYFRVPTGEDNPANLAWLTTTETINTRSKLLKNGSFEDSLRYWNFRVGKNAVADYRLTRADHKDGLNALEVGVSTTTGSLDVSLLHKDLPLKVGQTYLVRFWAKARKRSAPLKLVVKGSHTLTYDYKLYTGWQEFQFAFKAADPAVKIGFLFQASTVYSIDHIEILDEKNEAIDVPMNYMWQNKRAVNQYNWLSADGMVSEPLPDGRTAWTCSDGWYGYNDTTTNSMSTHQLLRNTLIVQDAAAPNGTLVTNIGGTLERPEAVMVPPDPQGHDNFFWPRDMTVENDSLKILLPDTRQQNAGDPVTYGNREAIGIFSLPDLILRSIEYMPFIDTIQYGTLVKADDGYTYAFSKHQVSQFEARAIVARFPTGHLSVTTPWQFLTNKGWSYDYHNSREIADVELYSVTRLGPNHYVSVFLNPLSDKVEALFAQSPSGPWVGRTIVGQLEGQQDILCYFSVIHEETARNGTYTISYSNIGDIGQMLDDKTVYWPTFIKADLKSLSPFKDSAGPAKLFNLVAKTAGKHVLLQWKTSTTAIDDRFAIERSADGMHNWQPVGFVNSKGSTLEAQQYSSYDLLPLEGDNYYRVKQASANNTAGTSNTDMIKITLGRPAVKVYPNPSKGDVYFQLDQYKGNKVMVQLTNMNGQVIYSAGIAVQAKGNYKLPLTGKPVAGVYTLSVTGTDLDQIIKLVIQ